MVGKREWWQIGEGARSGEAHQSVSVSWRKRIRQDNDGLYPMSATDFPRESREYLPMSVKKSRTTTAGPISGKMSEKVEAKTIARTQAPVAKVGL